MRVLTAISSPPLSPSPSPPRVVGSPRREEAREYESSPSKDRRLSTSSPVCSPAGATTSCEGEDSQDGNHSCVWTLESSFRIVLVCFFEIIGGDYLSKLLMELVNEDVTAIWSRIRHEEKILSKKRRWLMGSPVPNWKTKQELDTLCSSNEFIVESMLRDEDVSGETVRMAVEKSFRAFAGKEEGVYVVKDYADILGLGTYNCDALKSSKLLKIVSSALDNLNNAGLSRLTNILLGNKIKLEKTYPRMKRMVKIYLRKSIKSSDFSGHMGQLGDLLTDPCNFKVDTVNVVTLCSPSLISAANNILERLHDESSVVLHMLQRILRGVPDLHSEKSSMSRVSRDQLLEEVRCRCTDILIGLKTGDELPEPLAIAMALASLSLRIRGVSDVSVPQFYHFPSQAEALQNEVLKALIYCRKVSHREMKYMQHLLDPNGERPTRSFKIFTQKMLIQHLLQGGTTDIPKPLLNAISLINRKYWRKLQFYISKEKIGKEVECVLNVSAQLKQIIGDMSSNYDFGEEYANAYMDDLDSEDSEDGEWEFNDSSDLECINSITGKDANAGSYSLHLYGSHSDDERESVAESRPLTSSTCSPIAERTGKNCNDDHSEGLEFEKNGNRETVDLLGFSPPSCLQSVNGMQSKCNSHYLGTQEICDETSLVAYQLIGRLLDRFSLLEGMDLNNYAKSYLSGEASILSDCTAEGKSKVSSEMDTSMIFVRTVEELLPSFPKSRIEMVKKLMKPR